MGRWQPDAAERLAEAALDLFVDRGYDDTTVVEIADRAGLTKSTFFRHFADKREVLFKGQELLGRLLAQGIAAAPATAKPIDLLANGLAAVGAVAFAPARHEFVSRRRAVIAANPELQEREASKGAGLILAMTEALCARGVPDLTAGLVAQVGALALNMTYERWIESNDGEQFGELAREILSQLQAEFVAL